MKQMIFALFLCFFLCSCLNEGTDTGDPGLTNGGQPIQADPSTGNAVETIVVNFCKLMKTCEAVDPGSCQMQLLNQSNIDTELGLGANDYPTLNDISMALDNGAINVNATGLSQCLSAIDGLDCNSPGVPAAYDAGAGNPYQGVAAAIPTACTSVF